MLRECLTENRELVMYKKYPGIGDTEWNGLPEIRKQKIIETGEQYLHKSWPVLPATAFISIVRDGNRKNYEELYFARREALSALALAEVVENRGRFLDDIMNGIFCICEESGWAVPAHNTYVRDTPQLPLPISNRPILDLFACETGAILACVHYLLGEKLAGISEEIPARIERELQRRIIDPYLNEFFWFMGNDREPTNNWTVWCTRNVLLSAFLVRRDADTWSRVLEQAVRSVDCFIREYGDDGGCPEGASYYHHAALCMFECIDIMNRISGNVFETVFQEEKIRNIADYIRKVHICGEYFLNYADCDAKSGLAGIREYRFAKAAGLEDMMYFAASQLNLKRELYGMEPESRNICESLESIFSEAEALAFAQDYEDRFHGDREEADTKKKRGFQKYVSLPSIGIHAVQGKDLYLSVKSGSNCGSHKHNDAGSFIVYAKGSPLLIDVGVETYSQKTFSEQRYEIWTMQSDYHNLPSICGCGQVGRLQDLPGKYMAEDVKVSVGTTREGTEWFREEMELKKAYDDDTPIRSYRRYWQFSSEGDIEVKEVLDFTGSRRDWILNFMTEQQPVNEEREGAIRIGQLGKIIFNGVFRAEIEKIPITDQRLKRNWKDSVYRIRVIPGESTFQYWIHAL